MGCQQHQKLAAKIWWICMWYVSMVKDAGWNFLLPPWAWKCARWFQNNFSPSKAPLWCCTIKNHRWCSTCCWKGKAFPARLRHFHARMFPQICMQRCFISQGFRCLRESVHWRGDTDGRCNVWARVPSTSKTLKDGSSCKYWLKSPLKVNLSWPLAVISISVCSTWRSLLVFAA